MVMTSGLMRWRGGKRLFSVEGCPHHTDLRVGIEDMREEIRNGT